MRTFVKRALALGVFALAIAGAGTRGTQTIAWAQECLTLLQLAVFGPAIGGASGLEYAEADGGEGRLLVTAIGEGTAASILHVSAAGAVAIGASGPAGVMGAVRSGPCMGGFDAGDVFTDGAGAGQVARAGQAAAWVTLPEGGVVRALYQDRACAFDGDLLVATSEGAAGGTLWRVTAAGVATRVAQVDGLLAGLVTVPSDATRYGPIAGRALVGTADGLQAVDAGGDIVTIGGSGASFGLPQPVRPVDLELVPRARPDFAGDADFVGLEAGTGRLLTASAAAFGCNCGDLLVADASGGGGSGLSRLTWNGQAFDVAPVAAGAPAPGLDRMAFRGGIECRTCSGVIGNYLWRDLNGDGIRDAGEPVIGGATVVLTRPDAPAFRATARADAAGHYQFTGLCAGTYVVTVPASARLTEALEGGDRLVDSNMNGTRVTLPTDGDSDLTIGFGFK